MLKIFAALTLSASAGYAVATALTVDDTATVEPAYYEIRAVTYDGNEYVAGKGSDCRSAWEHAVVPRDWIDIACVPVN